MSDELPSFLGITPFGAYCVKCKFSLPIAKGIEKHGKDFHSDEKFKNGIVIREVHRQMKVLRERHANDLTPFLTERPSLHPTWFCTGCFSAFGKCGNYNRHLVSRGSTCSGASGGKVACYETICLRLAPKSCNLLTTPLSTLTIVSVGTSVSTLTENPANASTNQLLMVEPTSKVPATLLTTQEEACAILSPFVRADEDVRDLCLIYYPILASGFEGKMKEFLAYSANQPAEDGILFKWLEAGREWLGKYAAGHIANVSANVRSRLAEFEQKELDGIIVGSRTFTLRRGIPRLMNELDAVLRFFYRYPTTLFDIYKSGEVLNMTKKGMIELAIIPKILFTAAAEEPDDHGKLPVACLYCLSRGFTTKGGGLDLAMNECGWFASRISALLHLLRAGVCGYLVTLSGNTSNSLLTVQEMDIVAKIQNGRVTNLLAPYVKRLRDLNARKPPLKSNTVNANGDITSGGVSFPHSTWSTLIPRVVALAKACFEEVFEGSDWKIFMEKSINMIDWVRMDAFVVGDNCHVCLSDLKPKNDVEPLLARLQSIAELCFFGFGVGAVRHEEVIRLTVLSCQWHNSYLYFWSESIKRGSMKATNNKPKLVEHRLSLSLSKVLLLIRCAQTVSVGFDEMKLLTSNPDASMLGLVQDIFELDCQPQMLNVRHLFTSIGNVIMPENNMFGDDGCYVSTTTLTEKSGHTQVTGRRAYGTWLENSEEALYDLYHKNLGEEIVDPPVIDFVPFTEGILKKSLKELLGRKANYRSEDQKRMIDMAANSVVRHAFVGLPCGHGKSLSWMAPTVASYLSGRHVGLRIVILPYKFLLGHIVHHATSMLGLLEEKLGVSFLDSTQINKDTCPDMLTSKDVPSLVFLNLDGFALLIRFHMARLQTLAQQKILKRIYLDELQQLIVEYGFRSSYQCFRELGRIGVPIMCLSGSMPCEIAMSLMSYCGLTQTLESQSVDLVNPTDPVGDGFSFDVVVVNDVASAIIDFVLTSRVGACHVLCSSLVLVATISKELSKKLRVLSVTGNSSYQEQIRCAKNWLKGEYDVLVSTVVGLVGNENKFCKTIVVGGFLFNVSSLVQAIGRLRPSQRGADSKVQVFRFPFRSVDRVDASEKSVLLFGEVVEAGCLNEGNKEMFTKIYAPIGLQEILSMREGCYLQHLSACFGFARLPCNRCGLCLVSSSLASSNRLFDGNQISHTVQVNPYKKRSSSNAMICVDIKRSRSNDPNDIITNQQAAEETVKVSKLLRRKAKWVFGELLYRCLVCGKADCNGEMCLNACFRCGNRFHNNNACSFNTGKLLKIIPNKGVCFGCFDTRQHTMTKHDMKACPYKRRLKRLLFVDHERKGNGFEEYLRQLYSSELSFVSFVASYSNDTSLGRVWVVSRREAIVLECIQLQHDLPKTPLLPPDVIHNSPDISCDGIARSTRFKDVQKARAEYNKLRSEKKSCRRLRKFVFGAIYEAIFPGYFEVDPFDSDYDLKVTLHTGSESEIKIRLVAPDEGVGKTNLLSSMVELGRSLSGPGNARGNRVGDIGAMHAIGLKSQKELYKTSENTTKKVMTASTVMREWLEDNMREVLREVVQTDTNLKINYPPSMPRGPGSRLMVSVNLGNSPHYDSGDTSKSIAIWVEEKPGQSENWYFVLPNVSCKGSQGVIIKLVHGVVISWDGREIFHCSSKAVPGDGNKVYGCMWSSSR